MQRHRDMIAHQTIELTPLQFKQKLETIRDYAASAGGILAAGSGRCIP